MADSTQSFYDDLSASYHLIFADWDASVRRQGEVLDRLIRAGPGKAVTVLDCACGIGTQAIGLALHGYSVHATDLSPAAVERAGREAARFDVSITTGLADFRTLAEQVAGRFDVVMACDNALPHLIEDNDLRAAARSLAAKVAPGGMLLATIRDYDALRAERPTFDGLRLLGEPGDRRIVFQMWDWAEDGQTYTVNQFILREQDKEWVSEHYPARYRALTRAELSGFLAEAGFTDIRWNMADFYQPLLIARGPGEPSR